MEEMPQGLVIVITASSLKVMMQSAGQGDPTGLKREPAEAEAQQFGRAQTCEITPRGKKYGERKSKCSQKWSTCSLLPITLQSKKQEWPEMLRGSVVPRIQSLYLVVQPGNLLLTRGRQQEGVHLRLQSVVHLHVDVVAGGLLLVIGVHAAG